jgi:hypothetical protein
MAGVSVGSASTLNEWYKYDGLGNTYAKRMQHIGSAKPSPPIGKYKVDYVFYVKNNI